MTDEPEAELMDCAECGRELPPRVRICEQCSPPAPVTLRQDEPIDRLLWKARAQFMVGFALFPFIFAPIALVSALRASAALRASGRDDPSLRAAVTRVALAAGLGTAAICVLIYFLVVPRRR